MNKNKLGIFLGVSLFLNFIWIDNYISNLGVKVGIQEAKAATPIKIIHTNTNIIKKEKEYIIKEKDDKLSDWEMFTLALMKVESEYDSTAVSSVGAKGYFQIMPIYVEEINRVYGTNYKFKDVTDFKKAYEMFDLMQKAHNPDYDMDKALELHNGKHEWYNKRVYDAMDEIREYEKMREKLKNV